MPFKLKSLFFLVALVWGVLVFSLGAYAFKSGFAFFDFSDPEQFGSPRPEPSRTGIDSVLKSAWGLGTGGLHSLDRRTGPVSGAIALQTGASGSVAAAPGSGPSAGTGPWVVFQSMPSQGAWLAGSLPATSARGDGSAYGQGRPFASLSVSRQASRTQRELGAAAPEESSTGAVLSPPPSLLPPAALSSSSALSVTGPLVRETPGSSEAGASASPVPVPSSVLLFLSGLLGVVGLSARRKTAPPSDRPK